MLGYEAIGLHEKYFFRTGSNNLPFFQFRLRGSFLRVKNPFSFVVVTKNNRLRYRTPLRLRSLFWENFEMTNVVLYGLRSSTHSDHVTVVQGIMRKLVVFQVVTFFAYQNKSKATSNPCSVSRVEQLLICPHHVSFGLGLISICPFPQNSPFLSR